jgi:leucyl-tRNA synthetase
VKDQWFIAYGNAQWKKTAHAALKKIKLYPDTARPQFTYTIDWLRNWACSREAGMGTRLSWDEKWLIESLSDSTIYLCFDTIAHLVQQVPKKELNDALFDYILLGKGKKPKVKRIEQMRKEFSYWYPFDFNSSGKDLIQNHLTFALFNHTAIFPQKLWPNGYGLNGWVTVDGQKMSKSLGNFIMMRDLSAKYGADTSRFTIMAGGEGLSFTAAPLPYSCCTNASSCRSFSCMLSAKRESQLGSSMPSPPAMMVNREVSAPYFALRSRIMMKFPRDFDIFCPSTVTHPLRP